MRCGDGADHTLRLPIMSDTNTKAHLESVIISSSATIGEAVARLNEAGTGALALCSGKGKLVGLLTDGDIRRAILAHSMLDDSCRSISSLKPITGLQPLAPIDALRLMNRHDIDHLPVVDMDGVLHDFILRRDLGPEIEFEAATQQRLESVIVSPTTSIVEAIALLDKAGTGALVLCTNDRILCGLLTDGDIRRAILQGQSMNGPCVAIASQKPVAIPHSITAGEALQLMNQHEINHLPVVDAEHHVVGFLLRKDLVADTHVDLSAVIMAGGYGRRLLPLTESVPKPMLPVGDRPLLELTIQQLRRSGIRDVNVTTHYLSESIVNHFGNGEGFGVRLNYFREDHPMGTAGGLKQIKMANGPFLVINGDILTGIPFQEMLMYHRKHRAVLTVGVRKFDMQVPFGVVEFENARITKLKEKPSFSFFINAGAYLLEPCACDYIPEGRAFDMTDLVQKLMESGQLVVAFPIIEYWLDVGKKEDYQKAREDVRNGTFRG
jgi:dTDP-glucose pyrophosphorylase/CBS domain-containing protein